MIAETGPQIFTEKEPRSETRTDGALAPAKLDGVAQPGRARVGEARIFVEFRRGF